MKILKGFVLLSAVIILAYFLGPRPEAAPITSPDIAEWNISLDSLYDYVRYKDLDIPNLKPDNKSRIIWADSIRKTPYSLVYLHGFSASPMESFPTHITFAKRFGMNLYLPLLAGHGRDDIDSFEHLKPNDLIKSAKEAIAIGQLLGEQVIVMSCSTGSTLSIYLAAANKELIDGMIMYSPNIRLNDPTAGMITRPWGAQILKAVVGEYWNFDQKVDENTTNFWTTTYRSEGLITLQQLLDDTMQPKVFQQVTQPYFIGYYYKNEEEKDQTISTDAIMKYHEQTITPDHMKELVAFPDAGAHVIANPLKAQNVAAVFKATADYAENILKLTPVSEQGLEGK